MSRERPDQVRRRPVRGRSYSGGRNARQTQSGPYAAIVLGGLLVGSAVEASCSTMCFDKQFFMVA